MYNDIIYFVGYVYVCVPVYMYVSMLRVCTFIYVTYLVVVQQTLMLQANYQLYICSRYYNDIHEGIALVCGYILHFHLDNRSEIHCKKWCTYKNNESLRCIHRSLRSCPQIKTCQSLSSCVIQLVLVKATYTHQSQLYYTGGQFPCQHNTIGMHCYDNITIRSLSMHEDSPLAATQYIKGRV